MNEKQDELLNLDKKPKTDLQKILLYGSAVFLVFIVGVIGFALFNGKNSTQSEQSQIVPPKNENTDFVPLKVEESPKKEEVKKIEVPVEEKKAEMKPDVEEKPKIEEEPIPSSKDMPPVQNFGNEKTVEQKHIVKEKPVIHKKIAKSEVGKYYIQVAALLRRSPDKRFLKLIQKEGYNYRIIKTYRYQNGEKVLITKVLIGPYKTKKDAKNEILNIKEKITKTAFVYKVD